MRLFIHSDNGIAVTDDLDDDVTVGDVISSTGLDDAAAWAENSDEPLEPAASAASIGDQGHVFVGRCRKVTVTVHFAADRIERDFPPSVPVRVVRRWAIGPQGFDLPATEAPKHEVGVCGTEAVAEHDDHIGSLADACALCLDLVPKDRFQG